MAIVVLALWMFTAGAGIYLLVTSNLGRARPAADPAHNGLAQQIAPAADPGHDGLAPQMASAAAPSASNAAAPSASTPSSVTASSAPTVTASSGPAAAAASSAAAGAGPAKTARAARREARRAARDRWDPPSLARAKSEPMKPQFRSLVEFAHPACGLTGLAFWLAYTLIHSRPLAWIAFGLVAVTACAGLAWFTANARADRKSRRRDPAGPAEPAPSFHGRLIALHGGAAAVTLTLAALTALIARG